ncbi:hypothetical protein ES703_72270 [subsurface metagenome]
MSFIHVYNGRLYPKGLEGPDTTNSQDDLLPEPHLTVPAVKLASGSSKFRRIRFNIGVKHIQGNSPHVNAPDQNLDLFALEVHRYAEGSAFLIPDEYNRHVCKVVGRISLHLPAVGTEVLAEIALLIQEPHAHKWNIQIAGRFEVIPCQDPQPPGVNG